jgi:hypothetical protein
MIPIHLSLKEVAMRAGGKVMTKIDHTSAPIVGDPLGILGRQIKLHLSILLIIIIIYINYLSNYQLLDYILNYLQHVES